MNLPLRVLACAAVVCGAVLFVGCVLAPWLGGPSLRLTELPELCLRLCEEQQRSDALDATDRGIVEDFEVKNELTADVIAGRISVASAAAEFRRLRERQLAELPSSFQVPEYDDEAYVRQVMNWVRAKLQQDPRRDTVLDRLRRETGAVHSGKAH